MKESMKIKLNIGKQEFFNNGKIVLSHLNIERQIQQCLEKQVEVIVTKRNEKGKEMYVGINANSLNVEIRKLMQAISDIHNETHVENGVFFHNTKEGFDFSIYDDKYNMDKLRNYYVGSNGLNEGKEKLLNLYKKRGKKKKEWKEYIQEQYSEDNDYKDVQVEKNILTVVGEIQFGNWALAYRDLIRLLNADMNPGVDYYIYIAATGKLKDKLSSNIVTYESICNVVQENKNIVKTPMWIIGLDCEEEK